MKKNKIISFMGSGKSIFKNAKHTQKVPVWNALDSIRAEKGNFRDIDYSDRLR